LVHVNIPVCIRLCTAGIFEEEITLKEHYSAGDLLMSKTEHLKGVVMNKGLKKLTAAVLLTLSALSFSWAAGSQEGGTEGKPETVSITYKDSWAAFIEPAIQKYEETTGIKVEALVVPPSVNFDEKVALDLAGGIASDLILVDGYRMPEYAEAGYLYDMDDYLGEWEAWEHYFDSMQNMVSFDGNVYGLPVDTDVRMMWYWKPHFREAGIPLPWQPENWDDVLEAANAIKKACPEVQHPLYLPVGSKYGEATTMQGFYMLLLGADSSKEDRNRLRDWEEGKWIGKSDALLNTLKFYQEVFVKDQLSLVDIYYSPDTWGEWRRGMMAGNIGIGFGGSWEFKKFWTRTDMELPSVAERNEIIGWAPVPGNGTTSSSEIVSISGGWAFALNSQTKKADAAWDLLKTILEKDNIGNWFVEVGKISTRKDIAAMPSYVEDKYLSDITALVDYTTTRDTYPGYSKVSSYIQSATEEILDGKSPEEVMENYYSNLVMEFGEENVMTK